MKPIIGRVYRRKEELDGIYAVRVVSIRDLIRHQYLDSSGMVVGYGLINFDDFSERYPTDISSWDFLPLYGMVKDEYGTRKIINIGMDGKVFMLSKYGGYKGVSTSPYTTTQAKELGWKLLDCPTPKVCETCGRKLEE